MIYQNNEVRAERGVCRECVFFDHKKGQCKEKKAAKFEHKNNLKTCFDAGVVYKSAK